MEEQKERQRDEIDYKDLPKAKVWSSMELFGSESEIVIVHEDKVYRLRITKQGKLILYK